MRIIAGPCQHESLSQSFDIAKECKRVCDRYDIEYIFKASFDKANRTNISGKRGIGLEDTLKHFDTIKKSLEIKTLTDVHTEAQVYQIKDWNRMASSVDILQIPAFLCRQTDLIKAACDSGCIINVKKGQFLAPGDVKGILSKTAHYGATEVWITERGTSFGYGRLINDFTGMYDLLFDLGTNFVYDITHSVQRPGGNGTSSGGDRRYVPHLARAGAALGISSFFIEVHPDPDNAPSDGPNMLRLEDFEDTVKQIYHTYKTANNWHWL